MTQRAFTTALWRGCLLASALAMLGCGQVTRQMTLKSQPEGALVYLNGQEVGRTPCTVDFTWYGKYDVVLRREGSQTVKTTQSVVAPWWQWIPFDLLSDLTPGRKVDHREYSYMLKPQPETGVPGPILIDRGMSLKPMLESGEFTRKPTTQPTTQAAAPVTEPTPQTVEPSEQ